LDAKVVSSREDLIALVRARQDELNVSCATADQLAGLADGHFSKLTCGSKGFGFLSLFLILPALGLRIVIEEDPEMTAKLRRRWTPRSEAAIRRLRQKSARPASTHADSYDNFDDESL
jgi:hypothetical protein